MNKNEKIQMRLSSIMSFTGMIVVIVNFFRNILFRERSFIRALYEPSVSVVFIFSLSLFMTRRIKSRVIQYLQIFTLLANAALALIDGYATFHGIGLIILAVLLAFHYGLLDKHIRTKLLFISFFSYLFLEYAIYLSGENQVDSSINILIYLFFFLTITYLIYIEDISRILNIEKHYKTQMISMEKAKSRLLDDMEERMTELQLMDSRIKKLEQKIEESRKPLDFKEFNITPRELEIIQEFCTNPHLTTKELAFNLDMSAGTVKQHFTNIFRKLKIRNRPELLNKCKWNFK